MKMKSSREKYIEAMNEYMVGNDTIAFLSKKYGISTSHFSEFLKSNGVKDKRELLRKSKYKEALTRYVDENRSISSLAKEYSISEQEFRKYLIDDHIEIRRSKKECYSKCQIACEEYINTDSSINTLCRKYKISAEVFSKYLSDNNIKVLSKKEQAIKRCSKALVEYLNEDTSITKVCSKYKISHKFFSDYLKAENVTVKYNDNIEKNIRKYEKAANDYLDGNVSITVLSKKYSISGKELSKYIKRKNIEVINKQNLVRMNQNVFDKIDSEEKAYWLGFLYADGYVGSNGNEVGLALKESDYNHLVKYKKFLDYTGEIVYNEKTKSMKLQFKNKKIKEDLRLKGCVPRKSKVLKFPTYDIVPKDLMRHFVRGYVDGDGYVGIEKQHHARLAIISTENMLKGIIREMGFAPLSIRKANETGAEEVKVIEWGGIYVIDYLKSLYEGSNIYLDRKFERYKEIVRRYNIEKSTPKRKRVYPTIPIVQLDNHYNYIKTWNSISEAATTLKIDKSSIIRVCKKRQTTAGGFMWTYLEEYNEEDLISTKKI